MIVISFLRFLIVVIFVLATCTTLVLSFSNNVTDEQALLSFKASIKVDPLGALNSWNNSIHFCYWNGVTCSRRRQRVTALDLSSQHLVGTLSSHIGNISFLKSIFLYQNELYGSIPNEIGRLFRLQYLSIGNNSFQGVFLANLNHCLNIRVISMTRNNLKGNLPTEYTSWSKISWFDVGFNHFTGSIPPSLGNLTSLRVLSLGSNNLEGGIPLEIAHLTKLEIIIVSKNHLSGIVPLQLYNISSLSDLDLGSNELEGTLPSDLGLTLPKLQRFYGGTNRFSGLLSPSIVNASNLVLFSMAYNNITGPVPMNFGSLQNLQMLNLGGNLLGYNHKPDDLLFLDSLVNCTQLKVLAFNENGLRGKLPNSFSNLSTTIELLLLFGNNIYGSIPRDIGKFINLGGLGFDNNFFTGTIPESIGELSKLGRFFLNDNNISGKIPTSIGNITKLLVLSLQNNMLQGSIPPELFNISTLIQLAISNNHLGGVIPEQIIGLSSHCVFLYLHQNSFTGPLPATIGSLKQLVQLYVGNNKLTGDIPDTLGDCVMLERLGLEGNLFGGRIPSSFKALKSLVILDMSSNNISENIPSFFSQFRLIEFLNLSYNKLQGEVPMEGLFSNISAFTVIGNLRLCGGIQELQLPACRIKTSGKKKKTFPHRILIILVLLPLSILLACLVFIFYQHRKSKQINVPVPVVQGNQYPRLSYKDLLQATNGFSPNNLLGKGRCGSVYKGTLESLKQIIAVKVLNVEVRGANKSFLAECETLRNIRHRNLIKMITVCSSTDFKGNEFKALVFEFMVNGSLDNWLHPSPSNQGDERKLTLLQRLNISIDVALGVDYLHHHSDPSIIHCDIKPSNILLDEEFVACVGDFGLSRFSFATASNTNQESTSSTGVRGTIGYVPPEYGLGGEISVEGDVYSYGILVLEMFSGMRPTCSSILMDKSNNLRDYVKKALPHRVMDIADPQIVLNQEDHGLTANQLYDKNTIEICLQLVFEVGILCSVETPSERIDIGAAIKRLYVARDKLLQHKH